MKTTNFISKSEHKLFLFSVFTSFALSILCISRFAIEKYNESVVFDQLEKLSGYRAYSFEPTHPRFLVLSLTTLCFGIAFTLLFKFRTYLIAFFFNILSLPAFIYWWHFTATLISSFEDFSSAKTTDFILYQASYFDFSLFLLMVFLLFWQFSILLRGLFRNSQIKYSLP